MTVELHLCNFAGIVVGCNISTDNIAPADATIGRFKVYAVFERFPLWIFQMVLDNLQYSNK